MADLVERFAHYKTRIESVDKEHLNHLMIMAEIERMTIENLARVNEKIVRLIAELTEHWAVEDEEMVRLGYKPAAYHTADHKRMLGEMVKFKKSCGSGVNSDLYVTSSLTQMFLVHIDTMDIQYANWLQENHPTFFGNL